MREIVFDREFWPAMNTKLQTDLAKDLHQGATFWENFSLALSMLAAYDTDMLRADYNKFPAAPPSVPANGFNRFLSLSTFGSDSMGPDIKIRFRLEDGGNRVKIIGITGLP